MTDKPVPAPVADTNSQAQPNKESKKAEREALKQQQKRELPTNDWPGKGDA